MRQILTDTFLSKFFDDTLIFLSIINACFNFFRDLIPVPQALMGIKPFYNDSVYLC